jgi:DnaJ family protein A protein 2
MFSVETPISNIYTLIGVDKEASLQDIKRSYYKLAKIHHPDKGGNESVFKEITAAYEILSDNTKRTEYDQEHTIWHPRSRAEDIFHRLFGASAKGSDVEYKLKVHLAELYTGCSKRLLITRSVLCDACYGGGSPFNRQQCQDCRGTGYGRFSRIVTPAWQHNTKATCGTCVGSGRINTQVCVSCAGTKTKQIEKTLLVEIKPGSMNGDRFVFPKEANESIGSAAGDLVVVLDCLENPLFTRSGCHLHYRKTISVLESLVGFTFQLTSLDGNITSVHSATGEVYPNGCQRVIFSAGFPDLAQPGTYGNLYIHFTVEWPRPDEVPRVHYLLAELIHSQDCDGVILSPLASVPTSPKSDKN